MNGVVIARPRLSFILLWAFITLAWIATSVISFIFYKLKTQRGIEIDAFSSISSVILVAILFIYCISMFFTRVIISESTLICRYGFLTYRIPCNSIVSLKVILREVGQVIPMNITVEYSRHNRKNKRVLLEYAMFRAIDLERVVDVLVHKNPQLESDRQRITDMLAGIPL